MASQKKESNLFAWVTGLGVGTVLGAALGAAWYYRQTNEESTEPRRLRPAPSHRFTLTRAQIPKRHFKVCLKNAMDMFLRPYT
jgi:hypothetical protein